MAANEPSPGRRALRHAQTRDEILAAAAELVTEHGVDALNLSDVAARAGFGNAASLYRYFPSKDALVEALAALHLERLGEHLRRVPDELPAERQLTELCLAYLDFAIAHPAERRLIMVTTSSLPREQRILLPSDLLRRMYGLIREAIASGGVTARDEGDIFAMLHAGWALAQGMAESDAVYKDLGREVLRSRHRAVFTAFIEGFKSDWTANVDPAAPAQSPFAEL